MLGNYVSTKISIVSRYSNHLLKKYLLRILRLKLGAPKRIKYMNCCCYLLFGIFFLFKFEVDLNPLQLIKANRRREWISVETYHFFHQIVT